MDLVFLFDTLFPTKRSFFDRSSTDFFQERVDFFRQVIDVIYDLTHGFAVIICIEKVINQATYKIEQAMIIEK